MTSNRFQVLEDDYVCDEPCSIVTGDNLNRHQNDVFCRKGPKRKHVCYSVRKIEDIADEIDDIVVNYLEETVFVYNVRTNNVVTGNPEILFEIDNATVRKDNSMKFKSTRM